MACSEQDVLELLPPSITKNLDLSRMLRSSSDGLMALQLWNSSNRNTVSEKIATIVQEVGRQSQAYYEALTLSAAVAQDGFNWALDMEEYCAALQRGSRDKELLKGYLLLMRRGARDAQQRAQYVAGKFRSVSEGLRHVARNAEAERQSAVENAAASGALILVNQSRSEVQKAVNSTGAYIVSGALFGGAAIAGAPIVAAACGAFALGKWMGYSANKVEEHITDSQNTLLAENALNELHGALQLGPVIVGVNLIIQHVDVAVKWWGDMDTELEAIESKVARLEGQDLTILYLPYKLLKYAFQWFWPSNSGSSMQDGRGSQMDAGSIRANLEIIKSSIKQRKEDFREYKNQVKSLQARYPPALRS